MLLLALLLLFASLASVHSSDSTYYIGAGRYDITGPAAGVEMVRIRPPPPPLSPHFTQCMHTHTHTHMLLAFTGSLPLSILLCLQMGYAKPQQYTSGIHIRQWSRAFVIADAQQKSRIVFVSIDACMGTQILKNEVR